MKKPRDLTQAIAEIRAAAQRTLARHSETEAHFKRFKAELEEGRKIAAKVAGYQNNRLAPRFEPTVAQQMKIAAEFATIARTPR